MILAWPAGMDLKEMDSKMRSLFLNDIGMACGHELERNGFKDEVFVSE